MTRLAAIIVSMSICASCVDNPYYTQTSTEGMGQFSKTFAYGKFCGPNHPVLRQQKEGERELAFTDLRTLWPPMDDIDAVCYAHDYCVQQADQESILRQTFFSVRTVCDQAFTRTLADFNEDFRDPSCFNLAHDMSTGMYIGLSAQGGMTPELAAAAAIFAAGSRVSMAARSPSDEFPEEGACNLVTRSSPDMMLDAFEYYFDKSRAEMTATDLEIPRVAASGGPAVDSEVETKQ